MVKAVGSKQRDVKNANHRLILTQLRQHDLLSRSELDRKSTRLNSSHNA